MTNRDWYRRSSWDEQDQRDFFARLHRARSANRSQYLLIQARCLLEARAPGHAQGALHLLDTLVREHPNPIHLEQAHYEQARCLAALGRIDEAIDAYRLACKARRAAPNVRTYAPLAFGMLAVSHNLEHLYDETQAAFGSLVQSSDLVLPDAQYMYYAVRAILLARSGLREAAAECAEKALRAASMERSGFARHPDVGLVETRDMDIERRLRSMIESAASSLPLP